jgi:hypothetical protein
LFIRSLSGPFFYGEEAGPLLYRVHNLSFDPIGPYIPGNTRQAILRLGLQRQLHDGPNGDECQNCPAPKFAPEKIELRYHTAS